jgi:hypothetical protein
LYNIAKVTKNKTKVVFFYNFSKKTLSHLTGDIKYTMLNALIDKYSTPDIIELK